MYRTIVLLLVALVPLLIPVACDGDGEPEVTPGPTSTETPEITTTETPQAGVTPSTPDGEAQAAVVAPDQGGFLAQFGDAMIVGKTCAYDQDSSLADCGADGLYQLQGGVEGSEAVCQVLLVDDQPVGLGCQTEEPLQGIFYDIVLAPTPAP